MSDCEKKPTDIPVIKMGLDGQSNLQSILSVNHLLLKNHYAKLCFALQSF